MNKDKNTSVQSDHNCQCSQTNEQSEELKNKLVEAEDGWRRALADYQNLQKRHAKEKETFTDYLKVQIVLEFLPIFDSLQLASQHDSDNQLLVKQFAKILENLGVEEIPSLGEEFDPNFHEAVDFTEGKENIIVNVLSAGFKLGEKIIRPAKVTVGQG